MEDDRDIRELLKAEKTDPLAGNKDDPEKAAVPMGDDENNDRQRNSSTDDSDDESDPFDHTKNTRLGPQARLALSKSAQSAQDAATRDIDEESNPFDPAKNTSLTPEARVALSKSAVIKGNTRDIDEESDPFDPSKINGLTPEARIALSKSAVVKGDTLRQSNVPVRQQRNQQTCSMVETSRERKAWVGDGNDGRSRIAAQRKTSDPGPSGSVTQPKSRRKQAEGMNVSEIEESLVKKDEKVLKASMKNGGRHGRLSKSDVTPSTSGLRSSSSSVRSSASSKRSKKKNGTSSSDGASLRGSSTSSKKDRKAVSRASSMPAGD